MRTGALALLALVLIVIGVVLYGEADLRVGGWIALAGTLLALVSIAFARYELRNQDDDSP